MYLPKSKYTVSVAKIGEYELNGRSYTGPMITTYTGATYAGSSPDKITGELVSTADSGTLKTERAYVKRVPTEEEYKLGFMNRYFRQDKVSKKIVEVFPDEYQKNQGDTSYNWGTAYWQLTGPIEDQVVYAGVVKPGSRTINQRSINTMEKVLPGIVSSQVLCDPIQFCREV